MNSARAAAVAIAAFLVASAAAAEAPVDPVYEKNCAVCHQAGGIGMAGVYPRLQGRIGALAASPKGRAALLAVLLNGMAGKVESDHQPIMGVMPGFAQLSDGEIAEVLTYVARLGGGRVKAFKPADVASARKHPPQSPTEVNAIFKDPVLMKAAP